MTRNGLEIGSSLLLAVALAACSAQETARCTNDCRGYFRDPELARQVAKDTGLPICEDASIFKTTPPSREVAPTMPGYEVQIVTDKYCPEVMNSRLLKIVGKNLDPVSYETPGGLHVDIEYMLGTYSVGVWRARPGDRKVSGSQLRVSG